MIKRTYGEIHSQIIEDYQADGKGVPTECTYLIYEFYQTKNPRYIDMVIQMLEGLRTEPKGIIFKAIIDAAKLRADGLDFGKNKQIKNDFIKNQACMLMLNLQDYLNFNQQQAAEISAFWVYRKFGKAIYKSSVLVKEYRKYLKQNQSWINDRKSMPELNESAQKQWELLKDKFPFPPDGHEVLGK